MRWYKLWHRPYGVLHFRYRWMRDLYNFVKDKTNVPTPK